MTLDQYVLWVVSKYRLPTGPFSAAYRAGQRLSGLIKEWGRDYVLKVSYSGSYAKGTAVSGSTDLDLFISFHPQTHGTLKDIYESLYSYLAQKGYSPYRQNVSIRIEYSGLSVDLVPGRKQPGPTNDHSLFLNRAQTWRQTNVDTHVWLVSNSRRLDEIRALKIWRNLNQLTFPSFYLSGAVGPKCLA